MDELLNEEMFDSLDDARRKLALWRYDYNNPLGTLRCNALPGNGQTALIAREQNTRRSASELELNEGSAPDALAQTETEEYENQTRRLSL